MRVCHFTTWAGMKPRRLRVRILLAKIIRPVVQSVKADNEKTLFFARGSGTGREDGADVILTVTPNACVDKTYRVEDFTLDRVHRPSLAFTNAGGKGINVARVYRTLAAGTSSEGVRATGFLGGNNGEVVVLGLVAEEISDHFVRIQGETRVCIAVVDPKNGTQTEINERGPELRAEELAELPRTFSRLLSQDQIDFVVLSGSLPPNAPATLYADLIELARKADVRVVLDASGAALKAGVAACPWLVKPNRYELESLFEKPMDSLEAVLNAARSLISGGVSFVAATLGAEGALLVSATEAWQAVPPPIEFASAVASGDSFLAGLLWSLREKPNDWVSALQLATGAGAANAAEIGAGFCSREAIYNYAAHATVTRL